MPRPIRRRRPSVRALITCTLGLLIESPADAQSIADQQSAATQAAAANVFALNPAFVGAPDALSMAAILLPARTSQAANDAGDVGIRSRSGLCLGVGMQRPAGSSSYALEGELTAFAPGDNGAGSDGDGFNYVSRYLAARYRLTAGRAAVGLVVHGASYTVRKQRFTDGVQSDLSGYVLGAGIGSYVGDQHAGFGVYYLPAMTGSAEAEGEHRVLRRAGRIGGDALLALSAATSAGLAVQVHDRQTDDGVDADPGVVEFPGGVPPRVALDLGWQSHLGGSRFYRVSLARAFVDDPAASTGESRLKLWIGDDAGRRESHLGLGIRLDELTGERSQSPSEATDTSAVQIFLAHSLP